MELSYEDIKECVPHDSLSRAALDEFDSYFAGCDCGPLALCDDCNDCSCRKHTPLAYEADGRLRAEYLQPSTVLPPVMECGWTCGCKGRCLSRVVGRGSSLQLQAFPAAQKGIGLRTLLPIPSRSFVCQYVGEVISVEEAARRSEKHRNDTYIFTAQEYFGNARRKTCVDARKKGSLARFLNHSCDPNLAIVPVRLDVSVPRLCLFAKRDIMAGEELTVDYGRHEVDDGLSAAFSRKVCACGSSNCGGFLPFEETLFDDSIDEKGSLVCTIEIQ
ncbi:hypothetical protein RvY_18380 [Ramazzottius varieornatus]|uniref:SET domain-containing protein n=1 Tax=Ramazzottius varieornatus TaxID=947166 RepID=A0A1D1W605_RAMVA|nr:hypothetical protein RvY_18380 [Ramazzottius varieornatus]